MGKPFKGDILQGRILINNRFLRKRGMEYLPGFSLNFPKELSYGYLKFEGNGKISLGK